MPLLALFILLISPIKCRQGSSGVISSLSLGKLYKQDIKGK